MACLQSNLQQRDALIQRFLPLADSLAAQFHRRYSDLLERDDLIQVARLGLVQSAARVTNEGSAAAYLKQCITGELRHHLRDRARLVRLPARDQAAAPWRHLSLDAPHPCQSRQGGLAADEASTWLDQLADSTQGPAPDHDSPLVQQLLGLLPHRQAEALRLTAIDGHSLRAAARLLGVSVMTVIRARRDAIDQLRLTLSAQELLA